jgi:hypothetical protein
MDFLRSLPQHLARIGEAKLKSDNNPQHRPLQENPGELLVLQDPSYLLLASRTEPTTCTTVQPCSAVSPVISGDHIGAATPLVALPWSSVSIVHSRASKSASIHRIRGRSGSSWGADIITRSHRQVWLGLCQGGIWLGHWSTSQPLQLAVV